MFRLERGTVVRMRSAGRAAGSHGKPGKTAAGELPAHVCARDRPRAASDAGAGDGARKRGEGSPVALRAPYNASPRRKPRTRSVTDVLSLAVTHVMAHHISDPPSSPTPPRRPPPLDFKRCTSLPISLFNRP